MIGAGVGWAFRISGMGRVKPIAEGVRFSGLSLRFQPAPGGKGDKLIACGIFQRTNSLFVSVAGIELEEFVGFFSKMFRGVFFEGLNGGFVLLDGKSAFVVVPTCQERNIVLLAGGENGRNRFRQEIAVDVRSEAE